MLKPNDSVVAARSTQLSTDLSGEFVILNLIDENYYGLDGVGARVWQLIQRPCTIGEIVEHLSSEYDVARERCEQDLRALLTELAERSLVEVSPEPVP